ncbi:MAG TPA: alpha/beta fold hydrolase [Candidatus Acidoferrum sp.]|jgi:pimeloyl-ACP methyl ester carboxylesterase|nr:alpha/beta fold hydrolase [Candidatus Acidoferrum sp.]
MKLLVAAVLLAGTAWCAACTDVTKCTEWVPLNEGSWRSRIYTTYSLNTPNPAITRAFVLVHGTGRDADNYFRTALAAGFLAGALDDTIVISPRIASATSGCQDKLESNEVSYSCSGDSWRSGGTSTSSEKITSFDFVDEILRKLANRRTFPNLKTIVVAGHSAGGQFVNRYAMSNQVHDTLGVPITYIVANPSSYAYLDATRPRADADDFRAFSDSRNCTTYNKWPYGLVDRTGGYTAKESDDQLKKQLAARPVTYLLGEIDILPLGGFDASCPAMAQGPTRFARGQAFGKYVNQKFGAQHKTVTVPLCGHNARCMFTSEPALQIAFPKP